MESRVVVREGRQEDLPFVFATWLRNYYAGSLFAKRIPKNVFFKSHHQILERLMQRGAKALVAALPEDPDTIIGYVVFETKPEVIHFAYVKGPFRRMGIGRELLAKTGLAVEKREVACSHWTFTLDELSQRIPKLQYNPYLM